MEEERKESSVSLNARTILFIVLVVFLIIFLFSNSEELSKKVLIKFFSIEINNSVGVWCVISYILGIITWFIVTLKTSFTRRGIVKSKDAEIQEMMVELSKYRNKSIEDSIDSSEDGADNSTVSKV